MSEFGEYESFSTDEIKDIDRSFDIDESPFPFGDIKKHEGKEAELVKTYQELQQSPDTEHLAALYSEILVEADRCIDVAATILSELKNTQLIPVVAQSNMRSQAEEYLKATLEVITDGSSTISVFGEYMTFSDLKDIERYMEQMLTEFSEIGIDTDSFNEFIDKDLPVLDKYLFVQEQENSAPQAVRVIQHVDSDEDRFDFLKEGSFLNSDSVETSFSWSLFGKEGNLSDIVIVDVPHEYSFELDRQLYWDLLREYWVDIPQDERPMVIVSYNGADMDVYDQVMLQGFLISKGGDDNLRNTIKLAQRLVDIRKGVRNWDQPTLISIKEKDYDDESEDLREWEHITADTYQSLKAFITRANARNFMWEEAIGQLQKDGIIGDTLQEPKSLVFEPGMVPTPARTILDLGTGEGRIGGMLARAGFNVLGIDLSQEMLNKGEKRLKEEGAGLRGEISSPNLSYQVLQRLQEEGLLEGDIVLDDEQVSRKYLTAKGDFLSLYPVLENVIQNWSELYPDTDMHDFFDIDNNPYIHYRDDGEAFIPTFFSDIIFNWHTFNEINNTLDQKEVCELIFRLLAPGGELMIEIPDTQVDPYASAIRKYHEEHPEVPFGTVSDTRPDREGDFPPRYFPSRGEILALLQSVGFEISPPEDVNTYLITHQDKNGDLELQLKELVIHARKPRDIEWK